MSEKNLCRYSQGNAECLRGISVAIVKAMLNVLAQYPSL